MQAKVVDRICVLIEQRRRTSRRTRCFNFQKLYGLFFTKINKYVRLLFCLRFFLLGLDRYIMCISMCIRSVTWGWGEACKTEDRIRASITLLFIKVSILFSLLLFQTSFIILCTCHESE